MDPIITLISGGLGLLSGIGGGIAGLVKAGKQQREADRIQREADQFNNAMFHRQYYQDALSRSDTQNILRNLRNTLRDNNKTITNTAAVSGATPEAIAAATNNNARAYADAIAGIDAASAQRKDAALANYNAARNNAYSQWIANNRNAANNWANFASQAFPTGAGSIDTVTESLTNIKPTK